MMRARWRSVGFAGALGIAGALGGAMVSGLAIAQSSPELILPPGFDDPAPAPTPTPRPAPSPAQGNAGGNPGGNTPSPPRPPASPSVTPGNAGSAPADLPAIPSAGGARLPSASELENLSTDQLDELLGLKPKFDIPPAARRSLDQVGLLGTQEGGFPSESLAGQPVSLVRAMLAGTGTPLVSRWGHILVRRALVSRLSAPAAMDPVEFVTLRAGVLNRMGEYAATRSLVQDVDTSNWSAPLADQALTAYVAGSDPVGACPYVRLQGSARGGAKDDPQWALIAAICNAYAGESALASSQLSSALNRGIAPAIDVLLARRFAGAAGRSRQSVQIEWEGVDTLNPWRFAVANAVGEAIPEPLLEQTDPFYARAGAVSAMLPLQQRAQYAERAGAEGIFSAQAMVDLYSAIYADETIDGPMQERANRLRTAYTANDPAGRIAAMETLWKNGTDGTNGSAHWTSVLTAYAAARVPASEDLSDKAGVLIASMLTAGLDRDAAAWKPVVEEGSLGWALLALADPAGETASSGGIDSFVDDDTSAKQRRSQFLVAGLAGLGRVDAGTASSFNDSLSLGLTRQTKWSGMIARAAQVRNPAMVALLAGLGMQGDDWSQMTPLHLYHITSALRQVGLEAEARMIAAEAVSRA